MSTNCCAAGPRSRPVRPRSGASDVPANAWPTVVCAPNAELRGKALDAVAAPGRECDVRAPGRPPRRAVERGGVKPWRLAVARTIVDLRGADVIDAEHLALAMSLRAIPRPPPQGGVLMGVPPEARAAALVALPAMGPARTSRFPRWPPSEAWAHILDRSWLGAAEVARGAGREATTLAAMWSTAAADADSLRLAGSATSTQALVSRRWVLAVHPAPLADDIEPPATLFLPRRSVRDRGATGCHRGHAVGHSVRRRRRVPVRPWAHRGRRRRDIGPRGRHRRRGARRRAQQQRPRLIAVVGSGLDVIYPWRHAVLWRGRQRRGVVLSEAPLGAPPERCASSA